MYPRCCLAIVLACFVALSSSCGAKLTFSSTNRSGSVTDDYVEEPLSGKSARFERALEVSNAVLLQLQAHHTHEVWVDRFDPAVKSNVSEADLENVIQWTVEHFGALKSFKPMQWGFKALSENGRDRVCSTKLVEHERGMVRYHFVFADDGKFEKLLGISVFERKGVAPPGAP